MFDDDVAEVTMYKGLAFRSMHSHGRALNGLLPRAVDDVEAYNVREGEFVAGPLLGWNFGDGHFHGAQLLAAVQEQMDLDEGDIRDDHDRVPADLQFRDPKQRYRLHDVKTGVFEEGTVRVNEMTVARAVARRVGHDPGRGTYRSDELGDRRRLGPERALRRGDPRQSRSRGDGSRGRSTPSAAGPAARS